MWWWEGKSGTVVGWQVVGSSRRARLETCEEGRTATAYTITSSRVFPFRVPDLSVCCPIPIVLSSRPSRCIHEP